MGRCSVDTSKLWGTPPPPDASQYPRVEGNSVIVRPDPPDVGRRVYGAGGDLLEIVRIEPVWNTRKLHRNPLFWRGITADGLTLKLDALDRRAIAMAGYDISHTRHAAGDVSVLVIEAYWDGDVSRIGSVVNSRGS